MPPPPGTRFLPQARNMKSPWIFFSFPACTVRANPFPQRFLRNVSQGDDDVRSFLRKFSFALPAVHPRTKGPLNVSGPIYPSFTDSVQEQTLSVALSGESPSPSLLFTPALSLSSPTQDPRPGGGGADRLRGRS